MRGNFPSKKRGAAFTLIELMVVIIVIAIMSAVIVTEMSGTFQDALLRSSSRQLISVFSLASSRAISLNRLVRVHIDRGTGRYLLERHSRGDDFVPAGVPGGEGKLDSRVSVRLEEGESINFYPDGTADGEEVVLRDREGFGLALRVNPITARVEVLQLERQ